MQSASWFEEMKRRRVFRALIGYGVFSFAVLQIIEPVMHGLNLPNWVLSATVVGLGIGFPFTLVLAWALDLKGGRIERTGPAPSARLLLILIAIGVALGAPGVGWYFWRADRAVATRAEPASIAVLPFADLSPGKDQDWMCDGIAEEIIDALCTVTGLRVAARSSSFQFKGKPADVRVMTAALGVSTLLEGSVRKLDDRLRVSARLVSSDGYASTDRRSSPTPHAPYQLAMETEPSGKTPSPGWLTIAPWAPSRPYNAPTWPSRAAPSSAA